jgi:hypothetical protein
LGVVVAAESLSPDEVTALCSAGYEAWNKVPAKATHAKFQWQGRSYVARHTGFRLCVDTADGKPVVCRYD